MIITRTPYRISFFGGGTDYHTYSRAHGGEVISTTIDKYCYINVREYPPFFKKKYRILWSMIEDIDKVSQIKHPLIKGALKHYKVDKGLEIYHQGDLPARSGLGSSSSFAAGFISALHAMNSIYISKKELAEASINMEKNILKENVGMQDQIATAYGGFNHITFNKNDSFNVAPVILPLKNFKTLQKNILLFFTGRSRTASVLAGQQIKAIKSKIQVLNEMKAMVPEALKILNSKNSGMEDFGSLLHESWLLKKSITKEISNSFIDDIYKAGIKSGASGGKILGAGGGGFIIFYVKSEHQKNVIKKLKDLVHVPFMFDSSGSNIIYNNVDQNYSTSK